jgi:hypothetical protein
MIELREYTLNLEGRFLTYDLVDATLHQTLKTAHQYAAELISERGLGEGLTTPTGGRAPGLVFSTAEVNPVDVLVNTGTDLDKNQSDTVLDFRMPEDPSEPLMPDDEPDDDEPEDKPEDA